MKIGLIAMSGIRCADKELASIGLSLPGFLDRGRAIASMPNLALLTLAGMTPARHQIRYLEVPSLPETEELPEDFDMVAISSYTAQISEAYTLADRYRALGVPVVIGGLHASSMPHEAAQHADAVAIGEGEPIWLQILEDGERGELKQYYGARFSKFSLADAPMPAFHMLDASRYNRVLIQTSRGCPHRCEFCASSIMIADRYKQKPSDKVLAELDRVCEIWRRPFVELADDNAFVNRSYWYELLPQLAKRHVRWFAETDIAVANDDRLLALMQASGCMEVLVGLESPTQASMEGIESVSNWKYRMWPKYKEAVRRIQSRGIRVIGCFVLGLDGHTPETADQIFDFARYLELFDVQITIATAFPGTPLYARLVQEGRMLEPTNWDKCTLFDVNIKPDAMTSEELRISFRELAVRMYGEDIAQERRNGFKRNLRFSRAS